MDSSKEQLKTFIASGKNIISLIGEEGNCMLNQL